MGYSAFVMCDCYQTGKTGKPPYEEYVKIEDGYITLQIPESIKRENPKLAYKMDDQFDEWKQSACQHEDMECISEYITNIMGMTAFATIIKDRGGEERFPILTNNFLNQSEGYLPTKLLKPLLEELIAFENEKTEEEKVILYDKTTETTIASVNKDKCSIFLFTPCNNYGVAGEGFFILHNKMGGKKEVPTVAFVSEHFIQKKIKEDTYRFIDVPSHIYIDCDTGINFKKETDFAYKEFVIRREKKGITDEYGYLIESLRKLIHASLETGNPIVWV
jgi:hypothetical protein